MFEQIKAEMGAMPIRIEYNNGKVKCGVIVDYIEQENADIGSWKFIPYNNLTEYESTENPGLIERIEEAGIASIDMALK